MERTPIVVNIEGVVKDLKLEWQEMYKPRTGFKKRCPVVEAPDWQLKLIGRQIGLYAVKISDNEYKPNPKLKALGLGFGHGAYWLTLLSNEYKAEKDAKAEREKQENIAKLRADGYTVLTKEEAEKQTEANNTVAKLIAMMAGK